MRVPSRLLLVGALLLWAGARADAQDTTRFRPTDSVRKADSARARVDQLSATDRLLKVQQEGRALVAPLSRCGVTPLQPGGTRVVFDRDSIDWAAAQSVGELLSRIPGVFSERSDWIGMPEMPNVFSRGSASVEYVVDCVPRLPAGPDSVAVDPTIPLEFLERVEVERAPGMIRVFLFTRTQDRLAPRTKIGASQGDRGATRYYGSFERHYLGGMGLSVGADYVGLNAAPNGTGGGNTPSGWLQLSYSPSARFGLQAQMITQLANRYTLLGTTATDTLLVALKGTRTDELLRASWRQRADGIGTSLDVIAAHTSWTSDSFPTNVAFGQFGVIAARRAPTWSAQLSAWHYTRTTSLDTRLDLGWTPTQLLTASLQLVGQRHDANRGSQWATARVGVTLPGGFNLGGMLSDGQRVQSPTLTDDIAQRFTDAQLTAGFNSRLLTVDAGYVRNSGWRPQAFQELSAVAGLGPLPRTDWLTMHARLAPLGWLTFETLYQNPLSGVLPDATPPKHFLTTGTIRSRFLRNFPSGIFDLKLQAVLENWGAGVGGRGVDGAPIALPAATFFRSIIQFQIGPFIAYYDRINLQATRTGYVPGYPIQVAGTTFGIRWEFSN